MKAVAKPLRPGWYPAGDGYRQRYFGGTDRGWTNDYILEIHVRDPRRISHPAAIRDQLAMAAIGSLSMLLVVAGAVMVAVVA